MSPRRRLALLGALTSALLAPAPAPAQVAAAPQVLVVGDSLAVGMRPYLGELLAPGELTWDARSGRTTPQGLARLRRDLRRVDPDVAVVSLGTNDGSDPSRFADRVRRVLGALPERTCVVWPDISRPARKGPYAQLNRVLRAAAAADRRVSVVPWDRAVRSGAVVLPDHLHPDPAGFELRSRMVADAVARGCPAAGA